MKLKHKFVVLAILLLIVIMVIYSIESIQERQLRTSFLSAKKEELRRYIKLAQTAIAPLYKSGQNNSANQNEAKDKAKDILRRMNYGEDSYMVVNDLEGNSLVNAGNPLLEGRNQWNLRDPDGVMLNQEIIKIARQGGGFVQYKFKKPSTGRDTPKYTYAILLDRWGWVLSTGIYLDDVEHAMDALRKDIREIHSVLLIAAIMVFIAGMTLTLNEHRSADNERRLANEKLKAANEKLKALSQRIITSQEEERIRVSRDLHDGISQLLISTKYQFELAAHQVNENSESATITLNKGLASLTEAILEIRRISHALHPALLDNLGLPAALQQLIQEFSQRTDIQVELQANASPSLLSITEATTLFRIAQEAFTNIERHAHAQLVEVRLEQRDSTIRLSITDNGRGFNVDEINRPLSTGIGLRNLKERIEYHGGNLEMSSMLGQTELIAILPIRNIHHAPKFN